MSDKMNYKGSSATGSGKVHKTDSHYENKGGHERGGIAGSKKGIKHSFAGRHLHETEHHSRMHHEVSTDGFPSHEGDGPTDMGSTNMSLPSKRG